MRIPTFHHERELFAGGYVPIGIDEVGCGCLAGPVVACALFLPLSSRIRDIRDSKLLSAKKREHIVGLLAQRGARWAIGSASVEEIDRLNIRKATFCAMRRATRAFMAKFQAPSTKHQTNYKHQASKNQKCFDHLSLEFGDCFGIDTCDLVLCEREAVALVDAWTIPNLDIPQRAIIRGDKTVKSIAAASIVAKVIRDRFMFELDAQHPQYGFARHKGYGTNEHRRAIGAHGLSEVHRHTFVVH